jgi:hypothetical protein
MSRSRKKISFLPDYGRSKTKFYKNQAARKVRNYNKPLSDGCDYKRLYCSWNIRDFSFKPKKSDKKWYKKGLRK